MDEAVKVACAQVEPVVFDRAATLDKVATVAAEAAGQGARLVLLPETFVPVYPSSRWVRELVGGANGKPLFARLARESVEIPGPDSDRLGAIAREHRVHLALGVNERDALYESGVEVYLAPTADDTEKWLESIRHIARESRAFVLSCCVFQRASSYPADVPLGEGDELMGRGGSAIVGPDGEYLAGPLWDEEGLIYAELDPQRLYEERQRFDAAGHYSRPDVLRLSVQPISRATPKPE